MKIPKTFFTIKKEGGGGEGGYKKIIVLVEDCLVTRLLCYIVTKEKTGIHRGCFN